MRHSSVSKFRNGVTAFGILSSLIWKLTNFYSHKIKILDVSSTCMLGLRNVPNRPLSQPKITSKNTSTNFYFVEVFLRFFCRKQGSSQLLHAMPWIWLKSPKYVALHSSFIHDGRSSCASNCNATHFALSLGHIQWQGQWRWGSGSSLTISTWWLLWCRGLYWQVLHSRISVHLCPAEGDPGGPWGSPNDQNLCKGQCWFTYSTLYGHIPFVLPSSA